MSEHHYYNQANFPRLVWSRPERNWDIYADAIRGRRNAHDGFPDEP